MRFVSKYLCCCGNGEKSQKVALDVRKKRRRGEGYQ